ncbi:hypothetical protein Forpe1208_v015876 [Fusarium oxysporum f. sp. rapae]|uniref:Uncharacterized protein n=1 Tax=Fusarium oxysporum f. sp. rapae TaxID=485398 RepID=A0A8J5NHJ3_FUSOX|nr:hypothetical protein Forpe1208_v015876 [Fusarium oxysporum f. sp. rapae]
MQFSNPCIPYINKDPNQPRTTQLTDLMRSLQLLPSYYCVSAANHTTAKEQTILNCSCRKLQYSPIAPVLQAAGVLWLEATTLSPGERNEISRVIDSSLGQPTKRSIFKENTYQFITKRRSIGSY